MCLLMGIFCFVMVRESNFLMGSLDLNNVISVAQIYFMRNLVITDTSSKTKTIHPYNRLKIQAANTAVFHYFHLMLKNLGVHSLFLFKYYK